MSDPIVCTEVVTVKRERRLKSYTYEELLELFDGDDNVVRPLVVRCQRLEAAIRWALGEGDEFPHRIPGDGPYWWRHELRQRAALNPKQGGA